MYKSLQIKTLGSDSRENEQENFIKNLKLINQMENRSSDSQETNGALMTGAQEKNYSISLELVINESAILYKTAENVNLESKDAIDLLKDYDQISTRLKSMSDEINGHFTEEEGEFVEGKKGKWFETNYEDAEVEMYVRLEQKEA